MAIIQTVIQGSGGGGSDPYPLLSRVKDDNNNEIGTVCGYHTDANNQKYAVVCLDAQYRAYGQWLNYKYLVSNLPVYSNSYTAYTAKETATFNCDKIMEYCVSTGYSSGAVSHCRSISFTINGLTYYGQLPSLVEVLKVLEKATEINNADVTASSYPNLIIPSASKYIWTSTQRSTEMAHNIYENGATTGDNKTQTYFVIPILELPNA